MGEMGGRQSVYVFVQSLDRECVSFLSLFVNAAANKGADAFAGLFLDFGQIGHLLFCEENLRADGEFTHGL
jgi:hypothetical protein